MYKKLLFLDGFEKNTSAADSRGAGIQYVVARGLKEKTSDLQIVVVSNIYIAWADCSKYVDYYHCLNESQDEETYLAMVIDLIEKNNIDLIFPVSLQGVDFVLSHQDKLSSVCNISVLPDRMLFDTCVDKWKTYQTLSANHIALPDTELLVDFNQFDDSYYPRLFKPLSGSAGKGIFLLKEAPSEEFIQSFKKEKQPYLSQEYIEGYDLGCSVLCKNGKILLHTIQKGLSSNDNPFSPIVEKIKFMHNDAVLELATAIVKVLNYSGVANLDFRYDQQHNHFVLIEINPRYWGSLTASLSIGINFPYSHYLLSNGATFEQTNYEEKYFVTLHGLIKDIMTRKLNYKLSKDTLKYLFVDWCFYWIRIKGILKSKFKLNKK